MTDYATIKHDMSAAELAGVFDGRVVTSIIGEATRILSALVQQVSTQTVMQAKPRPLSNITLTWISKYVYFRHVVICSLLNFGILTS